MDLKALQAKLDATRDQKFRKFTDTQLTGFIKSADSKKADPNFKKRHKLWTKKQMTEVTTPFGVFDGAVEFTRFINSQLLSDKKIDYNDKKLSLPHLYYSTQDGPGQPTYETVFYTPYKIGVSCVPEIFEEAKLAGCKYALKNKHASNWIVTMMRREPNLYYKQKEIKREWLLNK